MKLTEGEASIACYPAAAPAGHGVQATLTSHRLVWSNGTIEEHHPLSHISCVTYGFQRAARSLIWAVVVLGLAVALSTGLLWAQANLPALAESMVKTLGAGESAERVAAARRAYQQRLDLLMMLVMPLWGLVGVMVMHASWLLYSGIRGETRVQFSLPDATRSLQQRGRDPKLLEFGEWAARRASGLNSAEGVAIEDTNPEFDDWIPKRPAKK